MAVYSTPFWPPPCSLPTVRSAGEEGLLIGKRCKSVQSGRRARGHEPLRVRQGPGSPECPRTEAWRLWPTVSHSSVACSLLRTPLWCLQFRVMANHTGELPTGMVWHSNGPAGRKKQHTLNSCNHAVARRGPHHLIRRRMEQVWRLRWFSVLSCAAALAFAVSMLELREGHGVDGHEVERDQHHAGFCG